MEQNSVHRLHHGSQHVVMTNPSVQFIVHHEPLRMSTMQVHGFVPILSRRFNVRAHPTFLSSPWHVRAAHPVLTLRRAKCDLLFHDLCRVGVALSFSFFFVGTLGYFFRSMYRTTASLFFLQK